MKKYKIKLFSSHDRGIEAMPKYWENFITYVVTKHNRDDDINEELKPWKAKFRSTIKRSPYGIRYLTFDSEQDAIIFMLRWS